MLHAYEYSLRFNSPYDWEVFSLQSRDNIKHKPRSLSAENLLLKNIDRSQEYWISKICFYLKMFSVPVKAEWQAARRNGKTLVTPDSMQFRINSKQGNNIKHITFVCFLFKLCLQLGIIFQRISAINNITKTYTHSEKFKIKRNKHCWRSQKACLRSIISYV